LGLLVVAAASAGIVARVLGRRRLRFPYLAGSLAEADYQLLASQPGWKRARITVAEGISLNGLVRPPQVPTAPWVLFYQGNDARMLGAGQAFLSRLAQGRDWGLAVYAYRGYDSSQGRARLADLAADAPLILAQLCATEGVERSRVHVVGFSIGGHLAVRAMSAAASVQPPASLSLLAPVDDIVMFRRSLLEAFDPGDDFQTRPYLDAVPAPVLVIQGDADEALLGPAQGRAIATKLGPRAQYVELAGAGHSSLLENEAALATLRGFIQSHAH
jgi:pimeloyl-ACP methyl ester carboxylesterase